MNTTAKRVLYWAPRVLSILFASFITMLSFDVFGEGYGFWGTIFALFMHLIPSFMVVIAILVAWRWEWIGAILFLAVAAFYLIISRGQFWSIAIPLVVTAVLFLLSWKFNTPHKKI